MTETPGNGAWLCKNSWGSGDERQGSGYFWASYYDTSAAEGYSYSVVMAPNDTVPQTLNAESSEFKLYYGKKKNLTVTIGPDQAEGGYVDAGLLYGDRGFQLSTVSGNWQSMVCEISATGTEKKKSDTLHFSLYDNAPTGDEWEDTLRHQLDINLSAKPLPRAQLNEITQDGKSCHPTTRISMDGQYCDMYDLVSGQTYKVDASVPYDAAYCEDDTGVTLISSDQSIATVDQDGNLTAKNYGKCMIRIKPKDPDNREIIRFCVRVNAKSIQSGEEEKEPDGGQRGNGISYCEHNWQLPGEGTIIRKCSASDIGSEKGGSIRVCCIMCGSSEVLDDVIAAPMIDMSESEITVTARLYDKSGRICLEKELKKGVDYTLSQDSVGLLVTFTPQCPYYEGSIHVTPVEEKAGGGNTPEESDVNNEPLTKPAKPVIRSVKTTGKKKIKVTISQNVKADGFEYVVCGDKKCKKILKRKRSKARTASFQKLKKGTYYIRVRAYRKNGKSRRYGKWSKKVKILFSENYIQFR
ncbi:MAG: hypothetical protein K5739_08455 [Lachnospiraceae bacterium]|nr:hypothetical protein [Lachnospiraceae bacterium]